MNRHFAIYARQSIDKADSISIDTQIERCLIEVGDGPYRIYSDRGYSGKNTDRPQFQHMLEAVKNGEIGCVVCYKLDRCSRSILDFTQLMDLFQKNDVAFISCTEKFDTATPMGRAMLNICIVFAQLERETIQQRITDAYHSRCKKGYYMGGRVPFGFTVEPYVLNGMKTSRYSVVDSEADILERIFSIYKEPAASLSDVVLGLNEAGIRNPRREDGLWVRPHIGRMIKNPIYVMADERVYDYFLEQHVIPDNDRADFIGRNGCYIYTINEDQHLVLAPHQGIISSQIWLRCQKHQSKRNRSSNHKTNASWLTGKLKCKNCGSSVTIRQSIGRNQKVYRYFICSAARGKGHLCPGFKPIPVQKTEEAVCNAILRHVQLLTERTRVCISDADPSDLLLETLSRISKTRKHEDPITEQLDRVLSLLRSENQSGSPAEPECQQNGCKNWDRLLDRLERWEELASEQKTQIVTYLIESIHIRESGVKILWSV